MGGGSGSITIGSPGIIGTDGILYMSGYAIYPNGIKKLSSIPCGGSATVGADGAIYCGSTVISPDGHIKWTISADIYGTTLGADGTLYGHTRDGLSAFETSSGGPADSPWPMFQHDLRRTGRAIDVTPPTIVTKIPPDGATDVGINIPVSATFSEDIDVVTINNMTFTVSGPDGPVPGTVAYNASTMRAIFTPSLYLNYNTTYTITITTGISDTAGHNMVSPQTWSFSTGKGNEFKILPSDGTAGDFFGCPVSISDNFAIVGSYGDDDNGSYSGSAYIFERNGSTWSQVAKLTASDGAANDLFGYWGISIYGGYAIVLSIKSAYIYEKSGSDWNQAAKLTASDGVAGDIFGGSVSISGDYVIVGAHEDDDNGTRSGSAYIFNLFPDPEDHDGHGLPDDLENSGRTDTNDADTDDDGIIDGMEDVNHNGVVDNGETNPCSVDTDGDGIQDRTELGYTLSDIGPDTDTNVFQPDMDDTTTTDPLDEDSDNDGLLDGQEDANHNGEVDGGETDPNVSDRPKAMPWIPLLLLDD